jgi:hypothetical protein
MTTIFYIFAAYIGVYLIYSSFTFGTKGFGSTIMGIIFALITVSSTMKVATADAGLGAVGLVFFAISVMSFQLWVAYCFSLYDPKFINFNAIKGLPDAVADTVADAGKTLAAAPGAVADTVADAGKTLAAAPGAVADTVADAGKTLAAAPAVAAKSLAAAPAVAAKSLAAAGTGLAAVPGAVVDTVAAVPAAVAAAPAAASAFSPVARTPNSKGSNAVWEASLAKEEKERKASLRKGRG